MQENMRVLLDMVTIVSNEKDMPASVIVDAVQAALVSATKKRYGTDREFEVVLDPATGECTTHRLWLVSDPDALADEDEAWNIAYHISLAQAQKRDPEAELGTVFREPVPSVGFGRIGAQAAKQVIIQRLRQAKRQQVVEEYRRKIGELVTGTVKKVTREFIVVELPNNGEAVLLRSEMIPREVFRMGDRVRAYLKEIKEDPKGPQLMLSRMCPEMLIELFRIEVPEIAEGSIEIKGAARDPGVRAKLAVMAKDTRLDPIGACVGMRGTRVQAVTKELGGERVDIVPWHESPAQFVIQALAPAEVKSIVVDDDAHSMDVIVAADQLASAIGKSGQNVRLASMLSGWSLNVVSDEQAQATQASERQRLMALFAEALDADDTLAGQLVDAGFVEIDDLAYAPQEEFLVLEGFDEALAEAIKERAQDFLLTHALAQEVEVSDKMEAAVLDLPSMDHALAAQLLSHNITTRDELAEQSVDDLMALDDMTEERAADIIMQARAHWFASDN